MCKRQGICLGWILCSVAFLSSNSVCAHEWQATPVASTAHAEALTHKTKKPDRLSNPHALYFELFGKGGLYGIGYDYTFSKWMGVGGATSFYSLDGLRTFSFCPYLNIYPIAGIHSALFVQPGLQVVHASDDSSMDGWQGTSATGVGGQVSIGYEYRNRFLFRVAFTSVFGKGGYAPWGGLSVGAALLNDSRPILAEYQFMLGHGGLRR
jgi:hypothetical protein